MSECQGVWGRMFGHHFQPRFSVAERPRESNVQGRATPEDFRAIITLTDQIYQGDVCTRCGWLVNRPPSPSAGTNV